MKKIEIFTDGACSGNPGPGGYGVILRYKGNSKELWGGDPSTTNNRMELTAVITALSALKEPCEVELYSDSKYIIDAVTKGWAKKWRANNWVKSDKKKALNSDRSYRWTYSASPITASENISSNGKEVFSAASSENLNLESPFCFRRYNSLYSFALGGFI